MGLETKQNEKTRSSPQISRIMISHHNLVSPWASPSRSNATASASLATPMALAMLVEIGLPFRCDTVL